METRQRSQTFDIHSTVGDTEAGMIRGNTTTEVKFANNPHQEKKWQSLIDKASYTSLKIKKNCTDNSKPTKIAKEKTIDKWWTRERRQAIGYDFWAG